jgi:hypothetical protein
MAEPRTATCPECGSHRETRAQPRTKLKCRDCATLYMAPALAVTPPDDAPESDPAPTPEPDPPTDPPREQKVGVKVVRADGVGVRAVVPLQPSGTEPAPTPEPDPPTDPAPTPRDPDPAPTPPRSAPAGRVRRSGRSRRPLSRGSR